MKILLTVPISCYRDSHPDIPDLGLGYLAASLRHCGHVPLLIDWGRKDSEKSFSAFISDHAPQAVGIKTFTKNFRAIRKTIRLVRKFSQDIPIILGGPHATAENPAKLLRDFPDVPYVIRGEAEEVLPRLLHALEQGDTSPDFPGLLTVSAGQNGFESGPVLLEEGAPDQPAWDLLDPSSYAPVTVGKKIAGLNISPIVATRGCPCHCTFCSTPLVSGKKIRYRSLEALLAEMRFLAEKHAVNQFVFVDMNFTHSREWLLNFCAAVQRIGEKVYWNGITSPGFYRYADASLLKRMKNAGCRTLVMGVETASPPVRERVKKQPGLEKITALSRWAEEAGIERRGYFMYGFPEETPDEMEATYQYAFSGLFDLLSFDLCFPLPGTEMLRQYLEKNQLAELQWDTFSPANPPAPISRASSRELASILRKSRLRAMVREKGILRTSVAVLKKIPVIVHG